MVKLLSVVYEFLIRHFLLIALVIPNFIVFPWFYIKDRTGYFIFLTVSAFVASLIIFYLRVDSFRIQKSQNVLKTYLLSYVNLKTKQDNWKIMVLLVMKTLAVFWLLNVLLPPLSMADYAYNQILKEYATPEDADKRFRAIQRLASFGHEKSILYCNEHSK